MTRSKISFCVAVIGIVGIALASASAQRGRGRGPVEPPGPPPLEELTLPSGFEISVFAESVPGARSMAMGEQGTIFVGTRRGQGPVYAVIDRDRDGVADEVKEILTGLQQPNGLEMRDGALYVAESTRVTRYDDIENRLDSPPAPVVLYDQLPSARSHSWKYLRFGPDGLLYTQVGAPCNICEDPILEDPRFASILRMKPDGSDVEIFAHGVRQTVGFDFHPVTGDLWFTDNGRDMLGDDVPNDELNVATEAGQHFGYPYCHQGDVADPEFGSKRPCSDFVAPAQFMGPHVAAIGAQFYTGDMFPAEYKNALFIAQHGSWNRSVPLGYRVMVAKIDGQRVTSFESFVEGFLQGYTTTGRGVRSDTFGRPVDVLQLPDGSLLISDDSPGRIYRVTYR